MRLINGCISLNTQISKSSKRLPAGTLLNDTSFNKFFRENKEKKRILPTQTETELEIGSVFGYLKQREMGNPKQKWTAEEEEALRAGVAKHGTGKWKNIQRDPEFNPFLFSRSNIDLKVFFLFLSF